MPEDVIYNGTGRTYHYQQPRRTMSHVRGSQADNALMNPLQRELQMALYFSALNPSLLPVHLQRRRTQLLLEQLLFLDRLAPWYNRKGIKIQPNPTICPVALEGVHLATWRPEGTITQNAGWGPAPPPANEVQRLMQQLKIKEAVLRQTVPLKFY